MYKCKTRSTEDCSALFEIEVSKEALQKAFDEVYDEIEKDAKIPGFRTGKAPRDIIEKHYREDAKEEVLKRVIADAYRSAIEEHKIHPIGYPEINDVVYKDNEPLLFKAKVDTHPQYKLKNYKGIKCEKKIAKLKNDDVDKALENLKEFNAKYVSADDRPVKMGDYTVCDMECFVDGKSVHPKREKAWLFIEKESMIPGLNEKIVGMTKGETREIEAALPEKYPDKTLAGKKATYRIFIREIKVKELPVLDDEFAKDMGKDDLASLRKQIEDELKARAELNANTEVENQVLKKLVDDNLFKIPKSFFERQVSYMVDDAKRRMMQKGFKKEDLDSKDNEFKDKFKADAERQVRLFFILNDIAMTEKIEVAQDEMEEAYQSLAAQTGRNVQEIKDHYEKEDLTGDLEEKIRESKTIQFLVKQADIKEVES